MAKVCPFCGKEVGNDLEHFRVAHGIKEPKDYEAKLARVEAKKARTAEFGRFIDDLNARKSKGLITSDEWRRLADAWQKERPEIDVEG